MITDDEKIEWMTSKKNLWWSSVLCVTFEISIVVSLIFWMWNIYASQAFGLMESLTGAMIIYLLYLPISSKNNNNNWTEVLHLSYMLYGTGILCYLVYTSEITLVNLPVLIISLWCIIGCQSYRNFNHYHDIWKRLDELLSIKNMKSDIVLINTVIFNLDSEKDEDKEEIKQYEEYKKFLNAKIEYLEEKYKD